MMYQYLIEQYTRDLLGQFLNKCTDKQLDVFSKVFQGNDCSSLPADKLPLALELVEHTLVRDRKLLGAHDVVAKEIFVFPDEDRQWITGRCTDDSGDELYNLYVWTDNYIDYPVFMNENSLCCGVIRYGVRSLEHLAALMNVAGFVRFY